MAEQQMSTPRITAPYLDNFVGRVVMLVGKVTQLRGDQATLDSDGTVTVLLNREAHLANGNGVQVIGKVNPDLSIKVLTSRDLGTTVGEFAIPGVWVVVITTPSMPPSSKRRINTKQSSSPTIDGYYQIMAPHSPYNPPTLPASPWSGLRPQTHHLRKHNLLHRITAIPLLQ
ncbi:Fc.00g046740.m01.CDS01 [Cosmosporella sp. VM-42]